MTPDELKAEAGRRLRELAEALDDAGIALDSAYAGVEVDETVIDGERFVQDVAIVTALETRYRLIDDTIVAARQLRHGVEAIVYDLDGDEIGRHVEPLPPPDPTGRLN